MQVLLAVVEDLYVFAISLFSLSRENIHIRQMPLSLPPSRVISPRRESTEIDAYRVAETAIQDRLAGATIGEGDNAYVPASVLAQKVADVYPVFAIGAENRPHDTSTVCLRLFILDEFGAGAEQLPLQAHEYVYYKLLRQGAHIAWPDVRPRTPGNWTKILSLLENVTIENTPTVGAVAEFIPVAEKEENNTTDKAHLAYVEKVFPDQSIQISEADWPNRGIYSERVLSEDEWRRLNASFIAVH